MDPVLERRLHIARLARTTQRVGYVLFGLAMVLFFAGLALGFGTLGPVVVGVLIVGSLVLLPAILVGYSVKAAEREDREQGRPTLGEQRP